MSGNYGAISIGVYQAALANPEFITIAAAGGQTPVLSQLTITSTSNWLFYGLKVQSLNNGVGSSNALVFVKDQGASYPTSNIIFENMSLSSQDDISSWTQAQWLATGRGGFSAIGSNAGANTTCISVTGTLIYNVTTGAQVMADKMVFTNNEIFHFGDDAIDYAASNLSITQNYIHDNSDIGDQAHPDGMQGVIGALLPGVAYNTYSNILIDSNTIIRQTETNPQFPTFLDGITAFDENWQNVTVSNNVVITSSCWGVAFLGSMHNTVLVNNTVLYDNLLTAPGCFPVVSIGDKSHQGPSSDHDVIENNLAMEYSTPTTNTTVTWNHNVCSSVVYPGRGPLCIFAFYNPDGSWNYGNDKPGLYPNNNVVDSGGPTSEFIDFNPPTLSYNVMLKSGAPAIGAGTANGAPKVDILGNPRSVPYDAGAYSYSSTTASSGN
jgi:hypothetical protein